MIFQKAFVLRGLSVFLSHQEVEPPHPADVLKGNSEKRDLGKTSFNKY